MNRNYKCRYTEVSIHNNKAVYLENERLKIGILTGKGCDVFEILYKPNDTDIMLRTQKGLDVFKGRVFSEERAKNYCEFYEGGWQDIIPSRAVWESNFIDGDESGESAAIDWKYDIIKNEPDEVSLKCQAHLPVFPLYIEKIFTIKSNISTLVLNESVKNMCDVGVSFTWTQHPAFGGAFLEPGVKVMLPVEYMFDYKNYVASGDARRAKYFYHAKKFPLDNQTYMDLTVLPERDNFRSIFATAMNIAHGEAELINTAKNMKIIMRWDKSTFPHLWYWLENTKDLYTLAIEPSTTFLPDLENSLREGMMITMAPKSVKETWISISVLSI